MKSNVLRLITRLNIGGPAIQALMLSRELGDTYPTILAAGHAPPEEGELTDPSVEVFRVPFVRPIQARKDFAAYRAVTQLIKEVRPRIIHTHMAKAGAIGRLAGSRVDATKTVHTFHGHVLQGYFSPRVEHAFIHVERFLAARTDVLIAVSEEVRDALLDIGIGRADQFRVIPLGFDLDPFLSIGPKTGGFRAELGLGIGVPLVAVISRIAPIKDHSTLLRAIARVPAAHLAIVGDGESRREVEEFARQLSIADRTHFVGWRHDVANLLADVDVVALTSRNEGTPVSLIEAGAAGRPVVATAVGGVAAVVQDRVTGLLVPPDDISAVASSLQWLFDNRPAAHALGRSARERVKEKFSRRRLLCDIKNLYDELTRSSSSVRSSAE